MSIFGGAGGTRYTREINETDLFELAINKALGDKMRSDDEVCKEVWSALADTGWRNKNGDEASYTYRAAGDLVAAIKGSGTYIDWYCCGPSETISKRVETALNAAGWFHDENYYKDL